MIDAAYVAMGGFGRLQKISYVFNTLCQTGAAFILQAFVFLEKQPEYTCINELGIISEGNTGTIQEDNRKQFCLAANPLDSTKANCLIDCCFIDYDRKESINNFIYQLNFYCTNDLWIGVLGASFLFGIVFGCSTLTRLGDVYGRKPIYMLGIVMHLFFMTFILFTTNKWVMFIMLVIFGMSISSRYYVGYTYNVEMQPKSHYILVSTT